MKQEKARILQFKETLKKQVTEKYECDHLKLRKPKDAVDHEANVNYASPRRMNEYVHQ